MTADTINLSAKPALQNLRIRVTGLRAFGWRMRVAASVMVLAGRIAGAPLDVSIDSKRVKVLDPEDFKIERRVGFVLVSTHEEIGFDGTRYRSWQKIGLPD